MFGIMNEQNEVRSRVGVPAMHVDNSGAAFAYTIEIQRILSTTSNPFDSAFSYLKFHMPSFSLFQYAPDAECMPLLPTALSPSVTSREPSFDGTSWTGLDCGVVCWMMVLVTANL